MKPCTLFDKVWDAHVVVPETAETPAVLYVDLHLVHEVTSPQAFAVLREKGLKVRRPERTLATMDHSTPTELRSNSSSLPMADAQAEQQLHELARNCREHGIRLLDMDSDQRGIVHVIGPELGATQPGMTIVCGDSHTSTHGAFGALAFGIGTTEVGHVLATQCLLQRKPQTLAVNVGGRLGPGVTAKDLILGIIRQLGVAGGTGHVIEYQGAAIRHLDMEGRMTVCNMSIEAGARAGMIAPDETTFASLRDRPLSPQGAAWEKAVAHWQTLTTEEGALFDKSISFDALRLEPMITYGTNPAMSVSLGETIPRKPDDPSHVKALKYMGLEEGQPTSGLPVEVVFIGSCTNSRLSDLRQAAHILQGKKIASKVRMLVVPGSQQVKRQAEAEGLARIFTDAGGEWRESGCSMCIAMNPDRVGPGQYAVSTSNRNFEGRQGPGARTFLASPLTAAASAITGRVTDPREFLEERS
jgi:3-isopropylmalate/(R)-2-methylmalate dehydratase large subunit